MEMTYSDSKQLKEKHYLFDACRSGQLSLAQLKSVASRKMQLQLND